jgi:methyl-accepting chemotaxis protein
MGKSITVRFITGALVSILGATLFALLYLLPLIKDAYLNERHDATMHLTELALSQVTELHRQAAAGVMTQEAAQAAAVNVMNSMQYSHNGYIWVLDKNAIMLTNSGAPSYVGQRMDSFKDAKGTPIFQQAIDLCRRAGQGHISYYWPKPGESSPSKKISYVRLFKPWGWIVGTGVYVDEVDQLIYNLRTKVLLAAAFLFLVSAGAIYLFFRNLVTKPLNQVTVALETIAAGQGDLTRRLATGAGGEFGRLAQAFNDFVDYIQTTITNLNQTLLQVTELSGTAQQASLSIRDAANCQFISLDEAAAALTCLNSAIIAIAADTKTLEQAAQGATLATSQITGSIAEITTTSTSLDAAADTIQGAVNQIASSLKHVTANLVVLAQLTQSATKSAANINQAIRDISASTKEQADIAKEVQDAASTAGLGLVNSTRQGMERIRHEVFTTNQAIESLAAKSGDIGHIVGLIGDIAEETNLLALNAAILAAQAGPHGKAFAVVAEKVRALARRSTASTRDIADIISQVQQEIMLASKAVKQSIAEVDKGMVTSTNAENALQEIVAQTESSLDMALQVEASIALQSKNLELNASAIDNFRKMSQDIKLGVDRQSKAADSILQSVTELRAVSTLLKNSIGDQAQESKQIADKITLLFDLARTTANNTLDQGQLTEQMVISFDIFKNQAEQNSALSLELEAATDGLNSQAALLGDRLASFKYAATDEHDHI